MRIKLLLLGLFISLGIKAQQLDPQRTGKDSVAIETSLVVMTEKFTTAEIFAFTRNTTEKPAYVFNSDTETLWAWTGTEWKDLGLAPLSGSLTFDLSPINGSTNPVESNGIFDRFVTAVDDDPATQFNDVTIYRGDSTHFEANRASLGNRYIAFVSDYEFDPSPSGTGQDAKINNVTVTGDVMTFTGDNGAFNGSVTLPSGGGNSTPQTITQSFSNSTLDLTTSIIDGNTQVTALDKLWQEAEDVVYNDNNSYLNANDVQEALDDLLEEGQITSVPVLISNIGVGTFTNIGQATIEYSRVGNIVFFNGYFSANFTGGNNTNDFISGGEFYIDLPGLPDFRNNIGQLQRNGVMFDFANSLSYPTYARRSYVSTFSNTTRVTLSWAVEAPASQPISITNGTWVFSGTYITGNVNN